MTLVTTLASSVLKYNVIDFASPCPIVPTAALDDQGGAGAANKTVCTMAAAMAAVSDDQARQIATRTRRAVELAETTMDHAVSAAAKEFREHDFVRADVDLARMMLTVSKWDVAWDGAVRKKAEKPGIIQMYRDGAKEFGERLGPQSYTCFTYKLFLVCALRCSRARAVCSATAPPLSACIDP